MKNAKLLFTLKEHFFKNCQILRESHVKAFCSLVIFSLGFFFNLGLIFYLGFFEGGRYQGKLINAGGSLPFK